MSKNRKIKLFVKIPGWENIINMQSTQGMVVEKRGKCNYFHREGHFKY